MAPRMPTHFDLMLIHFMYELYTLFVGRMGLDKEHSKWVISLWLWFELVGYKKFISRASSDNNDVVQGFIFESDACLYRCVRSSTGAGVHEGDNIELPFISSLIGEPMDLSFLDKHYDVVIKGVIYFYDKMNSIFGNSLTVASARTSDRYRINPFGEGSSKQGALMTAATATAMMAPWAQIGLQALPLSTSKQSSGLSPATRPWSRLHESMRSMFITFARGHPLSWQEVEEFFNRRYGRCFERVLIKKSKNGAPPLYGMVVFSNFSMIAVVLNGKPTAKFQVNGRDLWARIYLPRPNRD